MSLQTGTKFTL